MRKIGSSYFKRLEQIARLGAIHSAFFVRVASSAANFGCIALLYRLMGEDSAGAVLIGLSGSVLIATVMRLGQRQTTLAKVIEADRLSSKDGQDVLWSSLCIVLIGCAVGMLFCAWILETKFSILLIATALALSVTLGEGLRARRSFFAGTAMDQALALCLALYALLLAFLAQQPVTESTALNIFVLAFAVAMFCALALAIIEFGAPSLPSFIHVSKLLRSGASHLAANLSNVMMLHGPVVLLGILADAPTAGHMAVIMKVQSFALLPGSILALGAGPRIVETVSKQVSSVEFEQMQKLAANAAVVTCAIAIAFFFAGKWLLNMLLGEAPHELFLSMFLLLIAAIVQTASTLATTHLIYAGEGIFVVGSRLLVLVAFGVFIFLGESSLLTSSLALALLGMIASIMQLRRSAILLRRGLGEMGSEAV